ncbi:eukaryotic translation initiation factor 3subunit 7 [Striga asiatica]|uniref:Eukaryotic translation initiation factor 3subunit 7 n=1 Tax=Striga asiatica TaxID=4170 RepID=A0A5A7PYN7_STRAF|nr:eukaryotic translation initiation factor 3subunit 7 [Striga asiatica]
MQWARAFRRGRAGLHDEGYLHRAWGHDHDGRGFTGGDLVHEVHRLACGYAEGDGLSHSDGNGCRDGLRFDVGEQQRPTEAPHSMSVSPPAALFLSRSGACDEGYGLDNRSVVFNVGDFVCVGSLTDGRVGPYEVI